MAERPELFTNNAYLARRVSGTCHLVGGSAFDVLVALRDRIHLGGRLLTHPLCGNLRPHQQPFRSALLAGVSEDERLSLCAESLALVEEALAVYRSCEGRWALPGQIPVAVEEDYACVDAELMRETLTRYGLWTGVPGGTLREGR